VLPHDEGFIMLKADDADRQLTLVTNLLTEARAKLGLRK
jgi:hypothetical protein